MFRSTLSKTLQGHALRILLYQVKPSEKAGMEPLNIKKGENVLIIGSGPIGLLHLLLLKKKGARVCITDKHSGRLLIAKKVGADFIALRNPPSPPFIKGGKEGIWGLKDFIGFRIICQPAVFMRRELYEQVNGLDLNYHFMLDHHLWIRMASLAPVKYIPAIWAAARHHAAAKNVAQAEGFGRETLRLLAWMQTQDELAPLIRKNQRKVLAGASSITPSFYYTVNGQYDISIIPEFFLINDKLRIWSKINYASIFDRYYGMGNSTAEIENDKYLQDNFQEQVKLQPKLFDERLNIGVNYEI